MPRFNRRVSLLHAIPLSLSTPHHQLSWSLTFINHLTSQCSQTVLPTVYLQYLSACVRQVSQLLYTLVQHQESGVTQHLARLAAALTGALADDETDVVAAVRPGHRRGEVGSREG